MLINTLLDGIIVRLKTIEGLDVDKGSVLSPSAHRASVNATSVSFDSTMGRGMDEVSISVMVYVPKGSPSDGYVEAGEYLDGSGDKSLRTAMETSTTGDGLDSVAFIGFDAEIDPDGTPEYMTVTLTATAVVPGT